MANTAGRSKPPKRSDLNQIFRKVLLYALRFALLLFIVLMILVLWTDDLYDYSNWDLSLALQILGFLGIMGGFATYFFKPKISGWMIIISSIFFWIVTFVFRGLPWLGWLFLLFPLIGILILVLEKIQNLKQVPSRKKT
ncbi:hypothetical protein D9V84_10940 [Bacteroidetes/Chlorobi group bacterium Naka2016]|jgi:hypothetical protein|nr:MAG: hypothetical protein D9V84_10940 [Bacteroidetes/Chlorobi group bacterium Naka2016]